jgi:hypothetical protein
MMKRFLISRVDRLPGRKQVAWWKYILPLFSITFYCCTTGRLSSGYKGLPYADTVYKQGAQTIPGKIQCELYDLGGEGVAYHDNDSINSGSGKLNPADGSYLHEFRMREHVDVSYTKAKGIDDNAYNVVKPDMDQLYVGLTNPGEWTKYTVYVKKPGCYRVHIMYTAHDTGQVSISFNEKFDSAPLNIPSTYAAKDTVNWRQWHHWNYLEDLTFIQLKKGLQTLTLHTVTNGQMNYDYLDFAYFGKKKPGFGKGNFE